MSFFEKEGLNRFGEPLLTRIEEIKQKTANPESKFPIEIMGKMKQIPVISVRIEFPVYRLENGRTKSLQLEYLSLDKTKPRNLFTADPDSYEAQSAQHELLSKLVREEDLLSSFKDEHLEQVEPILCTNSGVVLNGNRRLCAWRILYYSDPDKFKYFETVSIAVLPPLDEKAISEIEKRLQIQKTMRAEYHWHTKALMADEELKKGEKDTVVARSFGLKKKELHILIEARNLADQYLRLTEHPDEWSRVDKTYYAFESIVVGESRISDDNERELFKKLAFGLIKSEKDIENTPSGRLYTLIKDYAANITAIALKLAEKQKEKDNEKEKDHHSPNEDKPTENITTPEEQKPIPSIEEKRQDEKKTTPADNPELPFSEDDLDILSGGEKIEQDAASSVSTAIDRGEATFTHSEIKDIIDVQKALQDEKTKSKILVDNLSKASAIIKQAVDNGLIEETSIEGVLEQIEAIQANLSKISSWVENKGK